MVRDTNYHASKVQERLDPAPAFNSEGCDSCTLPVCADIVERSMAKIQLSYVGWKFPVTGNKMHLNNPSQNMLFFLGGGRGQTKMSWRSLLTSQDSR